MLSGTWTRHVRQALEDLLTRGREPGAPQPLAVFELDEVLLCHSAADATFAYLTAKNLLEPGLLTALSPALTLAHEPVSLADGALVYYEALRRSDQQSGEAAAQTWLLQLLAGRTVADVVHATEQSLLLAEQSASATPYPRPFAYAEMADLVGRLRLGGFEVLILTATNTWTARWMVQRVLNPAIQLHHGPDAILPPDAVIGASTLIQDLETGRLWCDAALAALDPAYAYLDPEAIARYRLTPHLDHPLPLASGKWARLRDATRAPLVLAAGASLTDLPLLGHAEQRLWLARLGEPELQHTASGCMDSAAPSSWLIQPTLTASPSGFVASRSAMPAECRTPTVAAALRPWLERGWLPEF